MISSLRLQNFRSYQDDSFEFDPGVNIVVGPNASGKTNLLEAVYVLGVLKSYRGTSSDLIRQKAPWGRLEGQTGQGERIVKLYPAQTPPKQIVINKAVVKRPKLSHQLPVVLFEPEHLRLVHGSPERRRAYLDDLLSRTVDGYQRLRRAYQRCLNQRNALLKRGLEKTQQFVWDINLSDLAGQIVHARRQLIAKLNQQVAHTYSSIAGTKQPLSVTYHSPITSDNYSSAMLKRLSQTIERDVAYGFTTTGPHREDFSVQFGDQSAETSASRGEIRSLTLALKMIELAMLEESNSQPPILLLDDVFSELDGKRRRALTNYLNNHQTLITTTDADIVLKHFMTTCHIIPVERRHSLRLANH